MVFDKNHKTQIYCPEENNTSSSTYYPTAVRTFSNDNQLPVCYSTHIGVSHGNALGITTSLFWVFSAIGFLAL